MLCYASSAVGEILKAYKKRFSSENRRVNHWKTLCGKKEDLRVKRKTFGVLGRPVDTLLTSRKYPCGRPPTAAFSPTSLSSGVGGTALLLPLDVEGWEAEGPGFEPWPGREFRVTTKWVSVTSEVPDSSGIGWIRKFSSISKMDWNHRCCTRHWPVSMSVRRRCWNEWEKR